MFFVVVRLGKLPLSFSIILMGIHVERPNIITIILLHDNVIQVRYQLFKGTSVQLRRKRAKLSLIHS